MDLRKIYFVNNILWSAALITTMWMLVGMAVGAWETSILLAFTPVIAMCVLNVGMFYVHGRAMATLLSDGETDSRVILGNLSMVILMSASLLAMDHFTDVEMDIWLVTAPLWMSMVLITASLLALIPWMIMRWRDRDDVFDASADDNGQP